MDWIAIRSRGKELVGKYKYVLAVLLLGMVLMAVPEGRKTEDVPVEETVATQQTGLEERLEMILSQIEGVGRVEVLLTEKIGPETVFQRDEDSTVTAESQTQRIETVIIQNENRGEYALVQREDPPQYLGAIVVCQGAQNPSVQLQIAEAVAAVTGIGTDRITVLKMK